MKTHRDHYHSELYIGDIPCLEKIIEWHYSKMVFPNHTYESWRNDDGVYHREDGPARTWTHGHKEWWFNGEQLGFKEWKKIANPSNEILILIKLQYGIG